MSEVLKYLDDKKIQYKQEGREIIIKCGNCGKDKLYLNLDSQIYHCFRCEAVDPDNSWARGHLTKLKELWGDIVPITPVTEEDEGDEPDFTQLVERYHHALARNKSAIKYLYGRGFSDETIEKFKLGFVRWRDQDWLSIPIYEDGIPKLIKYRQLPPENEKVEKYRREAGGRSILFNTDIIENAKEVMIVEGELDAITLLQAGYTNVVGITGGAGTLRPEWQEKLVMMDRLVLVFDPDTPGQQAARDVWTARLGPSKCWNVKLPEGHDVNSFFLQNEKEQFDQLLAKASLFQIDGILSLKEALSKMYERSEEDDEGKLILPWTHINRLLGGGFAKQRLIVLGGIPGVGKTSFGIQLCYHFALKYKVPTLFFCLEMPEVSLATKIVQLHYDMDIEQVDYSDGLIYAQDLAGIPIYFGYSPGIKPHQFYETMKAVRDRYGVGFGVFDNLQRMVRTGEESDIAVASGLFKDITMDLNMPFMVISQPRKINSKRSPTMDDLKGSGAIPADADHVILMHRGITDVDGTDHYFDEECKVTIAKSRFSSGGTTSLIFKGAKSKFYNDEGEVYGAEQK